MSTASEARFDFRFIPRGAGPEGEVPLCIAMVDLRELGRVGLSVPAAIRAVAREVSEPVGINVFDMDAVTTTSDGIMVEGAIVAMGAGDAGRVHAEFGMLEIPPVLWSRELVDEEPHLAQWKALYPGRTLFRGPDPATKLVPVHNAVMTGRAVNNNSATEMMDVVTMDEILLPITGQLELMRGKPVLVGPTGEVVSVAIGMTVAERWGRVFPTRQFHAGDTAHGCGAYARTLKRSIPCILAPKAVPARHILRALGCGMVPGIHLACSPAVLAVARARGIAVDPHRITPAAREELESIGVEVERPPLAPPMSEIEIIGRADEIIPGADDAVEVTASELVTLRSARSRKE